MPEPDRGPTSSGSNRCAIDSPLEGSGFEPSVPLPRLSSIRAVRAEIIGRSTDVFRRDREFDVSALQGRLSTSSQSQCSTDPGLIAGTWHRPLFLTRDRWFESGSLQQTVRFSPEFASAREKAAVFRGCAGGRGWCGRERRATPGQHQVNRRYYLWRAIFQYRNAARYGSQQCRHWPACEVGLPGGVAVSASF